mgnify:CR=1 FL=1
MTVARDLVDRTDVLGARFRSMNDWGGGVLPPMVSAPTTTYDLGLDDAATRPRRSSTAYEFATGRRPRLQDLRWRKSGAVMLGTPLHQPRRPAGMATAAPHRPGLGRLRRRPPSPPGGIGECCRYRRVKLLVPCARLCRSIA